VASPRFGAGPPRKRLLAVLVVLVVIFLAVLVRVGSLQTSQGDQLRVAGDQQWTRTTKVPADRGTIFDRNGEELAMSVPASTVSVNPKLIDDAEGTAAVLAAVLGLSEEARVELLGELVAKDRGFVYVARQVDDSLGEQIDALDLAGVDVVREDRRILPGGDTGRSVIGRTDIDGIGSAGLELQYDDVLTGTGGEMTREVAPGGRSIPGSETVSLAPAPGDDLILTLDRSIQFATEKALIDQVSAIGARGATGIVMDTDTGEILSMASVRRDDETGLVEVSSGNYAAVDADEPGSVAKVITVAAALNEGTVTPDTGYVVPWRRQYADDLLRDSHEHPDEWMTVRQILVESSNIGTIDVQQTIGRERHWEYMRAFGLGETTALDFPGESAGILKHWSDLWGSERVTVAYGQGVASTSIQLVAAINVIANDGTYVAPKLVKATVGPDGEVVDAAPSATHEVVSTQTAEQVQAMMLAVVCDESGTASRARVDSFNVAGKTGTGLKAQANGTYFDANGNRVYYSSFVGFFPAEDPQVTLLISVDEPPADTNDRFGGTAAAPVFRELAPTIVHELGFRPPAAATACSAG
jgi:cell division protein FtsI (penicillin-binding protein 3)